MPFGTNAPPVIAWQLGLVVRVGVDRVRHPGRRRAAVRRRPVGAGPLADVPAVVGAGLALVDLLPASWPTSLMKKRVPVVFGSNAIRNGLRRPHAKVSWHLLPAVVLPVTLQRAVPAPWKGLVGGMPPVLVMRRIFPTSACWSREASFCPSQPPPRSRSRRRRR